jgi:hypothetical protein
MIPQNDIYQLIASWGPIIKKESGTADGHPSISVDDPDRYKYF